MSKKLVKSIEGRSGILSASCGAFSFNSSFTQTESKLMKKLMMAVCACVCAHGLFGDTLNVPSTDYPDIATAVAAAKSGDEIVVAAGTYLVSARLTVPSGVTLRGATGDFNDVIIAGGTAESATSSLVSGAVTVSQNATMRDLTIAHFKDSGVTATAWKSDQHIINCRITDVRATGDWNGTALAFQTKGSIENCVIDNCVVGPQQNGVFLFASTAVVDGCVITNNSVTMKTANATTMPPIVATTSGSTAIIKNSFIGFNKCGVVRPAKSAIASSTAWGVISMESGTFDNCVIAGNEFQGKLPYGICAIRRVGGTVKNTVIVENGMGADNVWTKSGTAANFVNCLTTGTDGMKDSVESQETDIFVREGGLPWLPYGSRAIGAGSGGGDIGRIWTPATLQCGIKRDKRTYLVGETANLTAVASDEATFAWELVAGDATLTDNGATATLLFNSAGTAKVKLTANGLASDEIELEAGLKTFDVASDAELEAAVDAAFDGAEIVLAEGDYAPTKTLVLKTAVTVRGATGDRDDVTVSGSNARRVFTIDHPGAVISSLTIKNGKSGFAGGVFMETGGMLTNVAVYGCSGTSYNGSYDSSNNNDAQWYTACGGVVCNYEGTVVDCDFSNSKRTVYYNSPGFYAQIGPDAVADRLIVTNNENTAKDTSKYLTAPVAITGGGTIRNAFVAYNDANYSGSTTYDDACGVFVDSGRLENSTVFRNVMAAADAARMPGIRLKKTTSYAVNCISVENAGKNGGATSNWAAADASLLTYCATTPVDGLDGTCVSFTGEPYELDAAGYPVSKSNSPTIDKGDDSLEWVSSGLDLYCAARFQGEHVDIGAVEYVPPTFAVSLSVLPDVYEGLDRVEALLTAVPDGDLEGVSAEWDLDGDGIYETKTGATLTQNIVITKFGTTCVSVHVRNTAGNEAFDHKDFTVNPSVVYVDPANTSGAAAPYATEETAATNIQDAVDVAGNGATVKIARGTYELAYPIVVKKPIAVEGVVGDIAAVTLTPQDIKVNGSLFVLNATGASVSYLTLKGARANRSFAPLGGVGASLNNTGANVIRFCRFTDFTDGDGWALPAGVRNDGGQVLDCTFDSQYDQGDACNPAVYWQSGAAALIDRCTIIGIRATSMCCQGANSRSTFVYIEGGTARNVLVGKCAVSTGKYTKENVPGQSYSNLAVPATFIYAKSGLIENCSVVDCTLASKSTDRLAAIKHDSAGVVRNCFAGGNVCTVQPDGGESTVYEMDFYSTGYDYCCGKDANVFGADHEGNVELASGTWRWRANGQLRMKNASPCANAGLYDATWMPSATDVYGSPRMVREDKVDIGAVLCREPGLMLLLK